MAKQANSGTVWPETVVPGTIVPIVLLNTGTPNGWRTGVADNPEALMLDDGQGGFEVSAGTSNPGLLSQLRMIKVGSVGNRVVTYE